MCEIKRLKQREKMLEKSICIIENLNEALRSENINLKAKLKKYESEGKQCQG